MTTDRPRAGGSSWTDEDLARLRRYWLDPSLPVWAIATRLGRTSFAVCAKAKKIGLPGKREGREASPETKARAARQKRASPVPPDAVRGAALSMGLRLRWDEVG